MKTLARGFIHQDGEIVCTECAADLGMDQSVECTPMWDEDGPQIAAQVALGPDPSMWDCAGTCGRTFYPELSMRACLPQHPALNYVRGWYREGRLEGVQGRFWNSMDQTYDLKESRWHGDWVPKENR